jgi:formylglycine-generating enzyme required for sulfatase activity
MKKTEQSSYSNGILLTTGGTERSNVMNIYDIAGNVSEWTLEKASRTSDLCDFRGGNFTDAGSSIAAASRHRGSADGSDSTLGFRVSLF